MRPVIRERPHLEGPVTYPRFPAAFRLPPLASWPSCPATGFRLPHGRPTGGWSRPPDLTGFPCSALVRYDRCRVPPIPRGRGAHVADIETSATTAASQRLALFSGGTSTYPELWLTRLTEVHTIHPSGLPLACDRWMEHRSLGFLPGFTPRRYQRRMPGAGTSGEHSLGANRRTFDPPFRLSRSHSATSCRTTTPQCSHFHAFSRRAAELPSRAAITSTTSCRVHPRACRTQLRG